MDLKSYVSKVNKRNLQPSYKIIRTNIRPKFKKIPGIKVLLCDIYGTIITSTSGSIGDLEKSTKVLKSFKKTIQEFKFGYYLKKINPKKNSEQLLKELFLKDIKSIHIKKKSKGAKSPEVRIELIWKSIINRLIKKGYVYDKKHFGNLLNFSYKVSYFYDVTVEKNILYDNVLNSLLKLKIHGIKLGIISNAQFYTPINLEILFREKSKNKKGLYELFDKNLCIFSYKVGESKPGVKMFDKIMDRFKNIKSNQILYIGNDAIKDIKLAKKFNFKTVLFAGDKSSIKVNKQVRPDAIISDWKQLPSLIQNG